MAESVSEDFELIVTLSTSSASLDRSPKENWVERAGELPPYIRKLARAIEKRGHSLSSAISIAIGRVKAWARGEGKVTAKTRAKAAAAVAAWEALKAKNAAKQIVKASYSFGEFAYITNSSEFVTMTVSDAWLAKNPDLIIDEVWDDYLIVRDSSGQVFKVEYRLESGNPVFGDPVLEDSVGKESDTEIGDEETALLDDYLN